LISSQYTDEEKGFIVLETNYRVYAYTGNPLQIAVLNLFVSLKSRFENLVIGVISRDSVRTALDNGIKADQIVTYLTAHAHPQMRKSSGPLLPPTVVDQIRLWEIEKDRTRTADGFLYTDFRSQADYDLVRTYAGEEMGLIIWEDATARRFFIGPEGHARVREFIQRRTMKQ